MKIKNLIFIIALLTLQIPGYNQIKYEGTHDDGLKTFQLDNGEMILKVPDSNDMKILESNGIKKLLMYGHMLGQGHMTGGMMGDMGSGETEWMHHMDDEHQEGDEHFGGFNMQDGTFTYSFSIMDGSTPYYLKFHGVKK